MDGRETLEVRLSSRGSVVLDVQYYCFLYVVHVVYSMIVHMVMFTCNICSIMYIRLDCTTRPCTRML